MEKIKYRCGKDIDSVNLKKNINKSESVEEARCFSSSIVPGEKIDLCPICSSSQKIHLQNIYGYEYVECGNCEVLFVENPPDPSELSRAYNSEYYTIANKKLLSGDNIIDYRVENIAKPKVKFVLEKITTTKKSWLDIGCGVGEILSVARSEGFNVLGVETNTEQVKFANKRFGLPVNNEYISKDTLSNYSEKYGVISIFNVLEHLVDPSKIIGLISNLQDVGDNIVIEVPHYPSITCFSQICYPDKINRTMHPPLHLFVFSVKSLVMLLKNHGYVITDAWLFGQDIYEFLTTLSLKEDGFSNSRLYDKLMEFVGELQAVVDQKKMSDQIIVVAKKIS